MKKINLLYVITFLLLGNGMLFSQAADRLYLSTASTGRIYDITALSATPTTAIALPTPLTTPNFSGAPTNASNLSVGYDVVGGNPNTIVFLQSNNTTNATIYKNGTAISTTMPNFQIGGIATNNVPGPYFGNVYGFQSDTKTLYPILPTGGAAINITSTDTDWNNGTTFGTDTFFDYQNNIYMFVNNGTNRYLFKISIATGVAVKAFPVAISGDANQTNLPTTQGIQGMAYLQGYVYIASVLQANNNIQIRRINMFDGTSTRVATYTSGSYSNLDLGTVPYYVPFQFTCGAISQTSNVPFVAGVASGNATGTGTNQKFITIPISNVYEDGNYIINVTGTDFTNPSYSAAVTRTTTSIQVPLIYNGTGAAGLRTLTVNLNGSSTACSVNVLVDGDTDSDGIGNSQDMDDDNDGILDTVEDACETEGTPVYSNTFTTGARTTDANVLNHTYAATGSIADGSYAVITSSAATDTYSQTDLTGGLDAGNPVITAGSTTGRYLMINVGANLLYQPIYRVSGLTVTPGTRYRFRIDMAGLANGTADIPNLQITIKDTNGNVLAYSGSPGLGMANDDVWRRLSLNFVATTPGVVLEIVNYQASGTAGNDIGIDNIVLAPLNICDADGDGIPNSQDFDSDNDGCFDAIEGSENVLSSQLNANGSINTATTGGLGSTAGVNFGVPNLVNAGGAADTGNNVGQGIGVSQDAIKNDCLDADSDGIPNWQDLDSDNDGILDIFECPDAFVSVNYSSTDGTVTNFSAPAADLGFIFDVYTLDNSFNLNINGVNLATSRLEFQPDQGDNIRFLDGATYGGGVVPQIYSMTGTAANPLVRIIIHKNGSVNIYGSKTGGGPLFPLQLYNGNVFNNITWNQSGPNSIVLTQLVVGPTYITGRGQGIKNGNCDPDGDGISNQYDVDSDGDGCADALEGSEAVKIDQIHSLSLPNTDANYAYRGQIKVLANGITAGTPSQVVSRIPGANGVPELLNYSIMNTSGIAGVVDNTDGTSDVGQAIGDSQAAAVNSCLCYKPSITAGTVLDTNQGITSLQRAGAVGSNWPMVRKGAWTALEAKTKGFVPNRLTTAQITAIPAASLIEGMMVYNTTLDCLQINTDGTAAGWKCFTTQTCTDVN
ncbi:thrombospondin type 3 repeat-containing protein [Epilithonimonas sp. JDS]|uniref:thrombospondin type 3 repeat-containing protein n=1 Tax=Epilithonimonas sp. JDS TaxID=2902797 RepID=UPI001E3DF2AC|nr:thrombospondin type 3 repeat-containing protein [Epilithonimonas sp. JDS]MCD9853125.1 thrombospondin type 3 repeat-containing protein [Epilithonimonas sp. JDS]